MNEPDKNPPVTDDDVVGDLKITNEDRIKYNSLLSDMIKNNTSS